MRIPLTLKSTLDASLQETDKAVIDVEAQDDGLLAKIVVCGIPVMALTSGSSRVRVIGPGRLEECCCR
jgi:hypothetical protein